MRLGTEQPGQSPQGGVSFKHPGLGAGVVLVLILLFEEGRAAPSKKVHRLQAAQFETLLAMIEPLFQIEVLIFRSQPADWAFCGQRSDASSQAVQTLVGYCDTGGVGGFGDGASGSGDAGGTSGST